MFYLTVITHNTEHFMSLRAFRSQFKQFDNHHSVTFFLLSIALLAS